MSSSSIRVFAHPDEKITECVNQCMQLAYAAAHRANEGDRPAVYRRLLHFCNARIIGYHSKFELPQGGDPTVAAVVEVAILDINVAVLKQFKGAQDQEILFYKYLHHGLYGYVSHCDLPSLFEGSPDNVLEYNLDR